MMNILFMTLIDFSSLEDRNIYTDLLSEFQRNGHRIYAVSPFEKENERKGQTELLAVSDSVKILKLKIGNVQKANPITKGISTITLERKFIRGIRRYFRDIHFDLVLYSTPPVTLQKAVKYVKQNSRAVTYLLLKDIFPQNAVDLGMLSTRGVRSIIYRYFRRKEKKLYKFSDFIGCMSEKNVKYILRHNTQILPEKIEVCPNSISIQRRTEEVDDRKTIREQYGIPKDKFVFLYGGNLGKPQGIPFMIECVQKSCISEQFLWVIVGNGTEFNLLQTAIGNCRNAMLLHALPKMEYDRLLYACDCGMIFLDYRFTIPNFPSRLLSYMEACLPVLAVTDLNSDVGDVVEQGHFGWKAESRDAGTVVAKMREIAQRNDLMEYGKSAYQYLVEHYSSERSYQIIMRHFKV